MHREFLTLHRGGSSVVRLFPNIGERIVDIGIRQKAIILSKRYHCIVELKRQVTLNPPKTIIREEESTIAL